MIHGFDNETAPLNEKELALIPLIVDRLKNAVGEKNAVFNQQICAISPYLKSARVRKLINYIRTEGLVPCLIASSRGYYIATSESELLEYENSLTNRATAIFQVRDSIAKQRRDRYTPMQLSLF